MGARHYSTVLGRFFQREPMTLIGPPNPTCPLSANPYIYSHNSPTTMSDISGLSEIGMTSTYNEGILTPPPPGDDPQPFVPLPDPDPGFTPPEDIGPKMPEAMEFRIPGMNPFPWWDRRNPDIPLPPNPWGWSTMSLTIPDDPGPPGTSPVVPPDLFRPKKPPGGFGGPSGKPGMPPIELMGATSGASGFENWPPGSTWGLADQHHQKGRVNTGSRGKSGKYGEMPNYGFISMGASYGSGQTQEQSDEDFNQAWKDSGIGRKIVGQVAFWTGVACAVAVVGTFTLAALGNVTALGMLASDPVIAGIINVGGRIFGRTAVNRAFGHFTKRFWHRGTFDSVLDSIAYHFKYHAGQRNIFQYTLDAVNWAKRNQSVLKFVRPTQHGYQPAWYFNYGNTGGGYFTTAGRILTFWG